MKHGNAKAAAPLLEEPFGVGVEQRLYGVSAFLLEKILDAVEDGFQEKMLKKFHLQSLLQIFGSIYTEALMVGILHLNMVSVLQPAKLLERFCLF